MRTLALDFGASNIRAAIVSPPKIQDKKQIKTPKTKSQILKELLDLIDEYKPFGRICIAMAGFEENQKTKGTDNMDFNNVPLRSILKKKYKAHIYIENDSKCAGLAEKHFGQGRNKKNFVLLTLGTGIGGAIFIDGKLYRGNSSAGEVGRLILHGKEFEDLASGTASVALGKSLISRKISSLEIEKLADKGNKKALEVYSKIGAYLGEGLLNISYILDPEMIILGGGFAKVKYIYKTTRKYFAKNDKFKRNIPIVHAKLSDDAGLIGAALLPKT